VTRIERPTPPLNADERTTLEAWLEFYRSTLVLKCDGLDDAASRTPAARPSSLTLQGLVQHMAEVERNWFRRVLAGEPAPPIYEQSSEESDHDGGFDVSEKASFLAAMDIWHDEVAHARANCAARGLDDTSPFMGAEVNLRWIYVHMIGEYARHSGHADLIRENIDGATGV
jgi:uncharacterized damage-inducible protein DinB